MTFRVSRTPYRCATAGRSVKISSTWSDTSSEISRHVTLNLYVNVSRLRFHAFLKDTCEHQEVGEEEEEDDDQEEEEEK